MATKLDSVRLHLELEGKLDDFKEQLEFLDTYRGTPKEIEGRGMKPAVPRINAKIGFKNLESLLTIFPQIEVDGITFFWGP